MSPHLLRPALVIASLLAAPAKAQARGINVRLDQPPTPAILAALEACGRVLDVIPEIRAVTLRADESALPAIRNLPFVVGANMDAQRRSSAMRMPPRDDFTSGGNQWNLDAINVTEFGANPPRTVPYDGEGVYVAVLDTGLSHNWREYFPEDRIDAEHARCFSGGGGLQGTVSTQPDVWQRDTNGHGTDVTSLILGFRYHGDVPGLPPTFNGVAPRVRIIPVCNYLGESGFSTWSSTATRSIVYVTNLKRSGALGNAPVVINMSQGGFEPDIIEVAAIDYAVANGVVFVAAGGNEADAGMRYPGAYPPVISAAAAGWTGQFPADDPTGIAWITRDFPENGLQQLFIAPFSCHALPGQELDIAAPGMAVAVPFTRDGRVDYTFSGGTSQACPHVAGVVALMLQKNRTLTPAQVEAILKATAVPFGAGCRTTIWPFLANGPAPTWRDHRNVTFAPFTVCWPANATGAGLLRADLALAATPAQ